MKQKLESTGCFKAVKVTIDTSELYENHSQHGHQIIFDLDEKLLNLSTHTGNVCVGVLHRNLFIGSFRS